MNLKNSLRAMHPDALSSETRKKMKAFLQDLAPYTEGYMLATPLGNEIGKVCVWLTRKGYKFETAQMPDGLNLKIFNKKDPSKKPQAKLRTLLENAARNGLTEMRILEEDLDIDYDSLFPVMAWLRDQGLGVVFKGGILHVYWGAYPEI